MNFEQIKSEIAAAQERIAQVEAGANLPKASRASLEELKARKKKLERERRAALLDATRRTALKKEVEQLDASITSIESDVHDLEEHLGELKQYLSEEAVLERARAALQAGKRVQNRLTNELPAWADRAAAAMLEVEQVLAQADEISRANSADFTALARVALENDPRDDTAHRMLDVMHRALHLRIDSVLAAWLSRCRIQERAPVEIQRPLDAPPTLHAMVEHHVDGMMEKTAELRARIENTEEEEAA